MSFFEGVIFASYEMLQIYKSYICFYSLHDCLFYKNSFNKQNSFPLLT